FVEDQSHLRPTLVTGLLEALKLNQSRGVAVSRLFETGRIFIERNGQNLECAAVAFVIAEASGERNWRQRETADFYTIKHHVAALAHAAGIDLTRQPYTTSTPSYFGWQEGHSAIAGDMSQGWTARFGLLNLGMVKALGVEGKVQAGIFAILPEKLTSEVTRRRYADFSLFPAALRDLALVVDAAAPAADVQKTLLKLARAAAVNAFAVESVSV